MEALGFELRNEAHLRTLTEDVVKSSEIEGETLEPNQVRSSIARCVLAWMSAAWSRQTAIWKVWSR